MLCGQAHHLYRMRIHLKHHFVWTYSLPVNQNFNAFFAYKYVERYAGESYNILDFSARWSIKNLELSVYFNNIWSLTLNRYRSRENRGGYAYCYSLINGYYYRIWTRHQTDVDEETVTSSLNVILPVSQVVTTGSSPSEGTVSACMS